MEIQEVLEDDLLETAEQNLVDQSPYPISAFFTQKEIIEALFSYTPRAAQPKTNAFWEFSKNPLLAKNITCLQRPQVSFPPIFSAPLTENQTAEKSPSLFTIAKENATSTNQVTKDTKGKEPKNLVLQLVQMHLKNTAILNNLAECINTRLEREMRLYEEFAINIYPDAALALEEQQEQQKNWEAFANVIEYAATSISILTGIALIAQGGNYQHYGCILAGTGAVNVANHTASKMKWWDTLAQTMTNDPIKQKTLAHGFQFGISITTSICGVLVGIHTVQMTTAQELPGMLTEFLGKLQALAKLSTTPFVTKAEVQRMQKERDLMRQEVKKKIHELTFSDMTKIVEKLTDANGKEEAAMAKTLNTLLAMYQKISNL